MKVSKSFENVIKSYLDDFVIKNPEFVNKYENPNKSIEECCSFICEEVQAMKVNGLSDEEVFGLAVHYFQEDKIKATGKSLANVVVNHAIDLTQEEKDKVKQKAIEQYQEQLIKNQKTKIAKEEKKKVEQGQLDLFNL